MSLTRLHWIYSTLLLTISVLGGCAAELDAGDVGEDEVGAPSEQGPSTHPIDALEQQVAVAPVEEAAPITQAAPSGRTDECGEVPATLTRANSGRRAAGVSVRRIHNWVAYTTTLQSLLVRLHTKLTVPVKPPRTGTIFLWPGVEPIEGPNWLPLGLGVLQPVLTWGPSCAGGISGYNSWTISGMYVNPTTRVTTHRSCHGGPIMSVNVGDVLDLDIALVPNSTVWKQTVKNLSSGKQVEYSIDMMGQEQGLAVFDVELQTSNKPPADSVYTETVLTFASPLASACTPSSQGSNDYVSTARLSADRTKCCIDRIAVRAPGVAATTTP